VRLHARVQVTQKADIDLQCFLGEWLVRHELTFAEAVRILLWTAARWMHYIVRDERHPDDPERKADEA
jgi:hypothetical protein